jgi:hypothetical protein
MKNTRKQSNGDQRRKTVTHFGIKRLLILDGLADPRVWIQRLVSYQLDDPGIVVRSDFAEMRNTWRISEK